MQSPVEFGSFEYENNRSVYEVIEEKNYEKPYYFKATFYHRTAGYMPAGSAGRWTEEVWGYNEYVDGARVGRYWRSEQEARKQYQEFLKRKGVLKDE